MSLSPPQSRSQSRRFDWCGPAAVVFLELLIYSAIQAPVPGVNEPQYLGKAAHYWNTNWAAGDRFLESSNPHLVFYVAVGWLTRFLSLAATAWIARVAGYGLLSIGWTALSFAVIRSRWAAVTSAAFFLLCGSIGNLSGEWLVGGIEGKTFAYALLLLAIAGWVSDRLLASALCLGLSISFHPIVGIWGLICGVGAEIASRKLKGTKPKPDLRTLVRLIVILVVTALPGIIPAALTLGGASRRDTAIANYMQVFWRLRHHLDPTQFSAARYCWYLVLFTAWLCVMAVSFKRRGLAEARGVDAPHRNTRWIVFISLTAVVAIIGVGVGWHFDSAWRMPLRDVRAALLKFYPFRLADVFVPLAFSLGLAQLITDRAIRSFASRSLIATITLAVFVTAVAKPLPDRNPSRLPPERLAAWQDVSAWARAATPAGTVFVTPSRYWGFKWFAHRAEYVNFKDSPQDTAGLLEWKRRLDVLREWWTSSADGRYSLGDLERLGEQTDADYLVTYAFPGRFEASPIYENKFYRVYRLR